MKKSTLYVIISIVFAGVIALIIYKYNRKETLEATATYALQERQGAAAKTEEWKNTRLHAADLLTKLKAKPEDAKSSLALAGIFIQEARVTGNYAYYDKAALKYVNDALKIDSLNFEALILKSVLYLSQHHFTEGLAIAEKAKNSNPYNSYVYGLMVDGNVESGNYKEAVKAAESMINIRPDIRSYSRISYLREIHGDYPGAIEAMKMAVDAGNPGDEGTEWARVQLGHLYENTGDLRNAEMHYRIALNERPGYAYALAGLGRLSTAAKNYKEAIGFYQQADSSVTDFSIKEALAEVYQSAGKKEEAEKLEKNVIDEMTKEAESGQADENIGHYVDRELAYAYLKTNDFDKALEHALLEYNRRPANIDVNEAVAWVYYCKGDFTKAVPYIKTALKTNSKNPTLLCRAGLIYAKTGDKPLAKTSLQQALQSNANIADNLKTESMSVLQAL